MPYEICYAVTTGQRYPTKVKEAFAYLLRTLWIDVAPLRKIQFPKHIRFWDSNKEIEAEQPEVLKKFKTC